MSKKVVIDLDLDLVGRVVNSPDPQNPRDLTPRDWGINNAHIIPIFLSRGFSSDHVHTSYLTYEEILDLMMERVSSVVRVSSGQDAGGAFADHTHTVTFTWNSSIGQIVGSVSTNNFHTHPFLSGTQPDPLSHADIKRVTNVALEETVEGFIRMKHGWLIPQGTLIRIVDSSEILII